MSATDLVARRIPNLIVLPAYPIAAVLLVVASAPRGWWWPLARAGIAAALLGGFYLALGLAFPAGMGLGDVKWAGVIGAYLGWLSWSAVPTGTLIAFLAAAVVRRRGRHRRATSASLPMAPFMTLGALVAVLATRSDPRGRSAFSGRPRRSCRPTPGWPPAGRTAGPRRSQHHHPYPGAAQLGEQRVQLLAVRGQAAVAVDHQYSRCRPGASASSRDSPGRPAPRSWSP